MDTTKSLGELPPKSAIDQAETALSAIPDPGVKNALTRLLDTVKNTPLRKEVEEFKKDVLKKPIPPEQQIFSFLPHQLAKTSIFFPMSDRELKEENRKINKLEVETSWGKVTIEGVKLAIFEEDIFLALLHLAKDQTQKDGEKFILKTSMPEIAKILYHGKSYTKKTYERIKQTLNNFQLVRFEIAVGEWKKKGKEKLKEERILSIAGILSGHDYKLETQELVLYWNPRFFAYFLESMLTNINLTLRRKLKKDGSKALLRFLCAHRNPGKMHLLTILKAINYNIDQPMSELRRRIKEFIAELKQQGVLGRKTRLFQDDSVYFDLIKNDQKKQISK